MELRGRHPQTGGCPTVAHLEGGPSEEQQPGKLVETKAASLVRSPCEPQLHLVVPPGSLFGADAQGSARDHARW